MHILVLEDDPVTALQLSAHIEAAGHSVQACVTTVEDALAAAVDTRFDLMIADIHLGTGGDGIRAARLLNERHDVKTVFVTGRADAAARDRAQEAWPLGFLVKPIGFPDLKRLIVMCETLVRPRDRMSRAAVIGDSRSATSNA